MSGATRHPSATLVFSKRPDIGQLLTFPGLRLAALGRYVTRKFAICEYKCYFVGTNMKQRREAQKRAECGQIHIPQRPAREITMPPRSYQPSRAELREEIDMPEADAETIRNAFFRPIKVRPKER